MELNQKNRMFPIEYSSYPAYEYRYVNEHGYICSAPDWSGLLIISLKYQDGRSITPTIETLQELKRLKLPRRVIKIVEQDIKHNEKILQRNRQYKFRKQ